MSKNQVPVNAASWRLPQVAFNVANNNLDGATGTYSSAISGGTSDSFIDIIYVKALVTTTDGMVRVFYNDGSTTKLLTEIPISARTASATVAAFETSFIPASPLPLPNGASVKFSTEKGESFVARCSIRDF